MKRIVICSDGTWSRPECNPEVDFPTNVLKLARGIEPVGHDGVGQQVFYDWGVGSYYDRVVGGITGEGLEKNVMDAYRYIVQNYAPGDELYLFGYSRGGYTVRSLCGFINNCGILKREHARLVEMAFSHYKNPEESWHPDGDDAKAFRAQHSHESRTVTFVGVWDTVGALGIPISFLGLFETHHEFYDTKLGSNVETARHGLAIDERRSDFMPTLWMHRPHLDLKQVWFCGDHSNVGGGCKPDSEGGILSDIPLSWMMQEAALKGLSIERHLRADLMVDPLADVNQKEPLLYRSRPHKERSLIIDDRPVQLHHSVQQRWERDDTYRPKNLQDLVARYGWETVVL